MGDVSLRLRGTTAHPDHAPDTPDPAASPTAARRRRTRWRDPKLWLGVVLVLASVVLGGRLLASADDTVEVWQVAHDIPAGATVASADLRVTRAHFDDAAVAAQYLRAGHPVQPGARATRDLHAGEILAVSAVGSGSAAPTRELPLGVGATHQPADLRAGDHVEVWAVPGSSPAGSRRVAAPALVLSDVTVLSVGGSAVGVAGERPVLVSMAPRADVGSILRRISGASVVLVRLGG